LKVLIDTCIWSTAFKKKDKRNAEVVRELSELIDEGRVALIGPIKQEILSAYKEKERFDKIQDHLQYFDNEFILDEDYNNAAQLFCECRANGVQGSHIDFLICAVSMRTQFSIFTKDKDFLQYKKWLPIELYEPRG
jgi:predicted nucleic acid-binding protein